MTKYVIRIAFWAIKLVMPIDIMRIALNSFLLAVFIRQTAEFFDLYIRISLIMRIISHHIALGII